MDNDEVDDLNNVARFYRSSKADRNGMPTGSAFQLRPGEEYLSVNCLEYLDSSKENQINGLRDFYSNIMRNVRSQDCLAILNVGEVKGTVLKELKRELRILHKPTKNNYSHCGIYDTSFDEDLIVELLAQTVNEVFSAALHNQG